MLLNVANEETLTTVPRNARESNKTEYRERMPNPSININSLSADACANYITDIGLFLSNTENFNSRFSSTPAQFAISEVDQQAVRIVHTEHKNILQRQPEKRISNSSASKTAAFITRRSLAPAPRQLVWDPERAIPVDFVDFMKMCAYCGHHAIMFELTDEEHENKVRQSASDYEERFVKYNETTPSMGKPSRKPSKNLCIG